MTTKIIIAIEHLEATIKAEFEKIFGSEHADKLKTITSAVVAASTPAPQVQAPVANQPSGIQMVAPSLSEPVVTVPAVLITPATEANQPSGVQVNASENLTDANAPQASVSANNSAPVNAAS